MSFNIYNNLYDFAESREEVIDLKNVLDSYEEQNSSFKKNMLVNDNLSYTPFFIISCGRSGSTLLRAILTNNKKISIPPESFVLPKMYVVYSKVNFLPWNDIIKVMLNIFKSSLQFSFWEIDLENVYDKLKELPEEQKSLAKLIDVIYTHYAENKFPEAEIWGDETPLNTLNIEYNAEMLNYHTILNKLGDTKMSHHENLKNPINTNSIGKWKKNLNQKQKQYVKKSLRNNLNRLHYKL